MVSPAKKIRCQNRYNMKFFGPRTKHQLLVAAAIVVFAVAAAVSVVRRRENFFHEETDAADAPPHSKSFYPIYIINLDRRKDRLAVTVQLLRDKGYDTDGMTRLKATDGVSEWESSKALVAPGALKPIYAGFRTEHNQLSKGAVGCYLSHVKLWSYLIADGCTDEAFAILEDDTNPTLSPSEVKRRLAFVPNDWDIVLLGAFYTGCRDVNEYVCRIGRFIGTHAMLVRKKAAAYLVPRAVPIEQQIDSWLSDLSERDEIKVYALRHSNWDQNVKINNTDIQTPMIKKGGGV